MRISVFVMSILIVGAIFSGFYGLVNSMASANGYNMNIDDSYNGTYNRIDAMANNISTNYQELVNITYDSDVVYIVTAVPKGLKLVKSVILAPFSIAGTFITSIVSKDTGLGLPSWVNAFLISALTCLIIFGVLALILRYDKT